MEKRAVSKEKKDSYCLYLLLFGPLTVAFFSISIFQFENNLTKTILLYVGLLALIFLNVRLNEWASKMNQNIYKKRFAKLNGNGRTIWIFNSKLYWVEETYVTEFVQYVFLNIPLLQIKEVKMMENSFEKDFYVKITLHKRFLKLGFQSNITLPVTEHEKELILLELQQYDIPIKNT